MALIELILALASFPPVPFLSVTVRDLVSGDSRYHPSHTHAHMRARAPSSPHEILIRYICRTVITIKTVFFFFAQVQEGRADR